MEGRPPGNLEIEAKDFFQKPVARCVISHAYRSLQVRKATVQDLVNVNLMRHAGIGRGKHHITSAFTSVLHQSAVKKTGIQSSDTSNNSCVCTNDKNSVCASSDSSLLKGNQSSVLGNTALLRSVLFVELHPKRTDYLPDTSLCVSCGETLAQIIRFLCVILKTEQASCCVYTKEFKSHQSVKQFFCYHSLHRPFTWENVCVYAMENSVKCGSASEVLNSQALKIINSAEEQSVLFTRCEEGDAVPALHDEVCLKHSEERPSSSKLEVGSNPSSLAHNSVSQFDVNGNCVPQPSNSKKVERFSPVSLSGNNSHQTLCVTEQCELFAKLDTSVCAQPCILKDSGNSELCGINTPVITVGHCATVQVTGICLNKRPVVSNSEKGVDFVSVSVKHKARYSATASDCIRCVEGVLPSVGSSGSAEKLFKGAVQCSKKFSLESANLSKSPPGVEVICDNYSESDIVVCDSVNKMMFFPALPSSHCVQQGKTDSSRFKSANEMASENSSSSNSDLENLSSVPTARKNNMQHAASYPSPISSTPQASYADVIRTPAAAVSKVHPPQGANPIFPENSKVTESSVQPPVENSAAEKLQKKEETHPMGSSEWIISRLSQLDVNTNAALNINGVSPHSTSNGLDFVNPQPIAVSLEKPSFYHSGLPTNKNNPYSMSLSPVNLSSPNKVNNENRGLTDSNQEKLPATKANERMTVHSASPPSVIALDLPNQKLDGPANGRTDSLSSNPSSMSSSICDAFKYACSSNEDNVDLKSKQPPVVIMDNFMPLENASGISFGIDYDEVIKLCSDSDVLANSMPFSEHPIQDLDQASVCNDSYSKAVDSSEKQCICAAGGDSSYTCDEPLCKKRANVDCSKSTSLVTVAGKNLYWRDVEVNNQACDISSLVGFLSESWNAIEKSLKKGSSNSDAKIKYFEPEHL